MAALTRDLAEAHSKNVKLQTSGPAAVMQLYCAWANGCWTTTMHTMIAQLCNPEVLEECGFVLVPDNDADIASAQVRAGCHKPQHTSHLLGSCGRQDGQEGSLPGSLFATSSELEHGLALRGKEFANPFAFAIICTQPSLPPRESLACLLA